MLPLESYNYKQFNQETLPEAICCCLQTCLLLVSFLLIEHIMNCVHIALTTCQLHCHMCPHYNVLPGAIWLFDPQHACAARVIVLGLAVCLSVTVFSATTHDKVAKN